MKNTIAGLLLTTAFILPAYAMAADNDAQTKHSVEYKDNGGYSTNTTSDQTDANGTRQTTEQTENVDVNKKGQVTKEVKAKVTKNPQGSGNKKVQSSDVKIEQKDNGGYTKSVDTQSTNKAGSDASTKSSTDVNVDDKGNVTKTVKTKKVIDPKTGLFSDQTTTTKTKMVNGKVVEQESDAPAPSTK